MPGTCLITQMPGNQWPCTDCTNNDFADSTWTVCHGPLAFNVSVSVSVSISLLWGDHELLDTQNRLPEEKIETVDFVWKSTCSLSNSDLRRAPLASPPDKLQLGWQPVGRNGLQNHSYRVIEWHSDRQLHYILVSCLPTCLVNVWQTWVAYHSLEKITWCIASWSLVPCTDIEQSSKGAAAVLFGNVLVHCIILAYLVPLHYHYVESIC